MGYSKVGKPNTPTYNCIAKPTSKRVIVIDELDEFANTIDTLDTVASTIDGLGLITIDIYTKIAKPTL